METRGRLVTCDMWLKEYPGFDYLEGLIEVAIVESNMHIVKDKKLKHFFEPQGETAIWILQESHFSIHTYPEHNYITIDCYTCGEEGDPIKCIEFIKDKLDTIDYKISYIKRGE